MSVVAVVAGKGGIVPKTKSKKIAPIVSDTARLHARASRALNGFESTPRETTTTFPRGRASAEKPWLIIHGEKAKRVLSDAKKGLTEIRTQAGGIRTHSPNQLDYETVRVEYLD
jgi:hypothetical protein